MMCSIGRAGSSLEGCKRAPSRGPRNTTAANKECNSLLLSPSLLYLPAVGASDYGMTSMDGGFCTVCQKEVPRPNALVGCWSLQLPSSGTIYFHCLSTMWEVGKLFTV